MKEHVNKAIPQYQVGFKPGKRMEQSTTALKKMIEEAKEDKTLAILTIDLKKAYDMVKGKSIRSPTVRHTGAQARPRPVQKHNDGHEDATRNRTGGKDDTLQQRNPTRQQAIPDAIQPDAEPGPEADGPTATPDNGIRGQHNILRKIQGRSGNHLGQSPKDEGIRPGSEQEVNANGNKRPRETTNEPTDADDRGQHEIPGNPPNEEDDQKRGNKEGRQRRSKRSEGP